MSRNAHSDDPDYIEALFCAAEMKAGATLGTRRGSFDEALPDEDTRDNPLKALAARELARINLRQRFLPSGFSANIDWMILLDLFITEGGAEAATVLATDANRWGISKPTAARYIAGLIESNLILRAPTSESCDKGTLELTNHGRTTVTNILSLYQKHSD